MTMICTYRPGRSEEGNVQEAQEVYTWLKDNGWEDNREMGDEDDEGAWLVNPATGEEIRLFHWKVGG